MKLQSREGKKHMMDNKKGVKNTEKKECSYSNLNNGTKHIKVFENERIEIARKAIAVLQDFPRIRGIKVKPHDKIPSEHAWQNIRNYPITSTHIINHLIRGGNWGLMHPAGMSCAIDGDTPEIRAAALSLGDTLEWNTGKPGHYCEVFLIRDALIGNIPLIDGAYIRGKGGQNLGPGSVHPNGNIYGATYLHLVPPVMVTKSELLKAFEPYIIGNEKLSKSNSRKECLHPLNPDSLTMKDLIDVSGFKQNGSKYQGPHPVHGSSTGSNFVVDIDLNEWHCFRHGTGGGPLQWIGVATGVISCNESVPGKIKGELFWRIIAAAHNQYKLGYDRLAEALGGDHYGKQ